MLANNNEIIWLIQTFATKGHLTCEGDKIKPNLLVTTPTLDIVVMSASTFSTHAKI